VPLLGRVLFDRDLARPAAKDVTPPEDDGSEPPGQVGPVRRGTRALWRLTQALWELAGIFDERPRGAWAWRVLGKIPVIGLAGGVLDERGAIAVAARRPPRCSLPTTSAEGAGPGTVRAAAPGGDGVPVAHGPRGPRCW
jgi:hypothetical protein